MEFETLVEKIKNPLRKQSLQGTPARLSPDQHTAQWKAYILNGDIIDQSDLAIKNRYLQFKKNFPERAEAWLDQQAKLDGLKQHRSKIEGGIKIYTKDGIDVFIDKYTDDGFIKNHYNMTTVKNSINKMLVDTRDLMPNRKPKIIITNGFKNPRFVNVDGNRAPAIYIDRLIYIDQDEINQPDIFIHEFAHFVADLIPKQTEPLLKKAYNDMLDIYWKSAKVKKRKVVADDQNNHKEVLEADRWRRVISKKLGFPEYGLRNFDEFFAVLIENWKTLPVNQTTYKFKSLVKGVLARL